MTQGIKIFEDNLVRLGIDVTKDPDAPPKKKTESYFSAEATMIKIKERTKQRGINQKERAKRRRKMLQDQKKAQEEIERQKAEEKLIERYLNDNEKVGGWGLASVLTLPLAIP